MGYLFGSIIVMESLFNYTGMGWLTYQALLNRDIPLIQATVFVIAAVVMLINLIVDLLYPFFDPRIKLK
jgi:peptide/nickel transport system permease protein